MADTTYYAWSRFNLVNEKGERVRIMPGDKVSASKLMVPDEEFDAYVESGAIRTTKYPDMGGYDGSPREYRLAQLAAASAGEEFEVLTSGLPAPPEKDVKDNG